MQCVHVHAYHVKFKIPTTCHVTSETLTHEYKIYQQATWLNHNRWSGLKGLNRRLGKRQEVTYWITF